MKTLTVLSLSYKKALLDVRSGFQFTEQERKQWYDTLHSFRGLKGGILLSTCNRTEFYLETTEEFSATTFIEDLQRNKQTCIPYDLFDIVTTTRESTCYIMEVANGLHSMVMGDKQILSQVKEAYREALAAGGITTLLERVFQAVFRTYKRIHNETFLHKGSKSISFLALKKIEKIAQQPPAALSILLIGAGEIAADFAKYATGKGFHRITVANRTHDRARSLSERFNLVVIPFHEIKENLHRFDVVVSCASVPGLITENDLPDGCKAIFIDLTTYHSLALRPAQEVYFFFTLDDLGRERSVHEAAQLKAVPLAKLIIDEAWQVLEHWMHMRRTKQPALLLN